MDLVRRLVPTIGGYGSLVIFIIQIAPPVTRLTAWQWLLLGLAVLTFLLQAKEDVVQSRRVATFKPGDEQQRNIRDWLYTRIDHGGRIAIFSRDLSWVADEKVKRLLMRKAESHELTIVTPEPTEFIDQLVARGAEAFHYGPDHLTKSRFTVTHFGQTDSAVAIGRRDTNGIHRVETFAAGSSALALAEDLVGIVRSLERRDLDS